MTLQHLLALVPWPMVATWIASQAIPYLSALATGKPGWLTGVFTMGLSLLDAFCGELARADGHPDWRLLLGNAFLVWGAAALHHSKVLKDTTIEATLYGLPRRAAPPEQPKVAA